jgi:phage terminase large subunit-like protein
MIRDWWWKDKKMLALWNKIHNMTQEEFAKIDPKVKSDLQYWYGNLFFFKPYPAQKPIVNDDAFSVYIHGNNSSGKSYVAAAKTAYNIIGWNPYYKIPEPKYGNRIIWAFSPSFDIQRTSSQVHLFSTDTPNDIGLLPSIESIEKRGGKVAWGKNRCIDFVRFWDGTLLEFKSAEMKTQNLQASGIDFCWFDECPPNIMHDEILARLLRKSGKMTMSFIVEDATANYIVQDIYARQGDDPDTSFHFIDVYDNLSLEEAEIDRYKKRFTENAMHWRFSEGGKFQLQPKGALVYPDFSERHVVDDLVEQYDPLRTLWRSWDMGFVRPACVGYQIDKFGRKNILFSLMGHNIQLTDFIDEVESYCNEVLPKVMQTMDILPHDANRKYDVSPHSALDIFHTKGLHNVDTIYVKREMSHAQANDELKKFTKGEPMVRLDSKHCTILCQALAVYTRHETTGDPRKDNYYEHVSDAYKLGCYYMMKKVVNSVDVDTKEPEYFSMDFGARSAERKTVS